MKHVIAEIPRLSAYSDMQLAVEDQRTAEARTDPYSDDVPCMARHAALEFAVERRLDVMPDEYLRPGQSFQLGAQRIVFQKIQIR